MNVNKNLEFCMALASRAQRVEIPGGSEMQRSEHNTWAFADYDVQSKRLN
jgi:hypothetical protein